MNEQESIYVVNSAGERVELDPELVADLVQMEQRVRAEEEAEGAAPEDLSPEQAQARALRLVFDGVHTRSANGKLTCPATWEEEGLVPPHLTAEEFAELVFTTLDAGECAVEDSDASDDRDDGEPEEQAESAEQHYDTDNIVVLEGKKTRYLYSMRHMTAAYAGWALLAAEDDKVATFVSCVREESRVYPRPMVNRTLMHKPYYMSAADVQQAWDAVRESGEYPDIRTCTTSNRDVYYYSTDYLSEAQAKALAEFYSVTRVMNP